MWKILICSIFLNQFYSTISIGIYKEYNVTGDLNGIKQSTEADRKYFQISSSDDINFDIINIVHENLSNFSFECTFRLKNESLKNYLDDWYLFDIKNRDNKNMYIALSSSKKRAIFYMDLCTTVSKIEFPNVEVFDGKWHSLMFSVIENSLKFYVDCEIRKSTKNLTKLFIENCRMQRVAITNIQVAQGVNIKRTIPIDISKMRFHPYPLMPAYAKCEDVDSSHRANNDIELKTSYKAFSSPKTNGSLKICESFIWLLSALVLIRFYGKLR